ncbi:MAG TPA: hypothetical protein VJS65_17130 [Verrucomicrobiae bacterium]|nr:hypothetical protein [Verrucomicrobiae bacterium]
MQQHAIAGSTTLGRLLWVALLVSLPAAFAADPPKAPVPKSPYIAVVYRYADTLLEKGRDNSGSFFSAIDRTTLTALTNDAASGSINPQHDENLLRLLYFLTELTTKAKYREAADRCLRTFLKATSPANGPTWSERRSWTLWDRCFALEPEVSHRLTWDLKKLATGTNDTGRRAGFCIRSWATAIARTGDGKFTNAIFEQAVSIPSSLGTGLTNFDAASAVSLAIDCDGAAHLVSSSLAQDLRRVASSLDGIFCALPHDLSKARGFFVKLTEKSERPEFIVTPQWIAGNTEPTTAQVGMMCVSRYDNSARSDYLRLLVAAADSYHDSFPSDDTDVPPRTFGHVISLQVAAWRHTAKPIYLEQARKFADLAIEKFFGTSALPRASLKREHYESGTGADTLALALAELHLQVLHITAVRCPPNTIDR